MSDAHAILRYRYTWGEGGEWWLLRDLLGQIPKYAEILEEHHPMVNSLMEDGSYECSGCGCGFVSWAKCETRYELFEVASELFALVQPQIAEIMNSAYIMRAVLE